ncbi:MAG: cyclic nucleotide-binding domain-containing protein [Sulfuritalea sp.]|nr:cyclic nucleotide-binding domain-containing protein [Sulfuritalea sp.]
MNERDIDRFVKLIYAAPLGDYIGRNGAEMLVGCLSDEPVVTLKKGELLYRKGDLAENFFIVIDGHLARLREGDTPGKESIVHVLAKGDLVGEINFFDGTPRSLTVRALEDASLLRFEEAHVKPMLMQNPQIMYDFMRAVIKRVNHVATVIAEQEMELQQYILNAGRQRR